MPTPPAAGVTPPTRGVLLTFVLVIATAVVAAFTSKWAGWGTVLVVSAAALAIASYVSVLATLKHWLEAVAVAAPTLTFAVCIVGDALSARTLPAYVAILALAVAFTIVMLLGVTGNLRVDAEASAPVLDAIRTVQLLLTAIVVISATASWATRLDIGVFDALSQAIAG